MSVDLVPGLFSRRVGLGCMNLSHAYGVPPSREVAVKFLNQALDLGYTHLDTAALYGFGANELLVGDGLSHRRNEFFLASKCGLFKDETGQRCIDGRPETIKKTCDESLRRLKSEWIDLYYLHRWDKSVPIEESVGAMADLVQAGKISAIGLSEVSADTLRKAHRETPIAAVQTEYSLWTRNPEIKVLQVCAELDVDFVAFSPLARGFLGGELDVTQLIDRDIRKKMPRFQLDNYRQNECLLEIVESIAQTHSVTKAQIALAWVLHQAPHIVAIPGTTNLQHLIDNLAAETIVLSSSELGSLDQAFKPAAIRGSRYGKATQQEIDTEEFVE